MPKMKNTSLFSSRNFVILLATDNKDMLRGDVLIAPLVEEFKRNITKTDLEIVHIDSISNADNQLTLLSTINTLQCTTKPTIVEIPRAAMDDKLPSCRMLQTYITMLIMSMGGIVINSSPDVEADKILELETILPIINFNTIRDSWEDLQPKISSLIHTMANHSNIQYYNMFSVVSGKVQKTNLGVCLGDISRMWVQNPSTETVLKTVINLSGDFNTSIDPCEFSRKIWCNSQIGEIDPYHTFIARTPSSSSQLVLGKLMSQPGVVDSNLKIINV